METQKMGSQGGGAAQEPKLQQSLARQGSLYSLTLDEVRNQLGDLGKPLGSMNLDELLKSVWSAEANIDSNGGELRSALSMHRQGSVTLSVNLTEKTVDDVWRDIQEKKNNGDQGRKALGEMTLEDFLVKAGVVDQMILPAQQHDPDHWMQYQNMMSGFVTGQSVRAGNAILDVTYPDNQMTMSPYALMGTLSDTQTLGRKRVAPEDLVVRGVDRRQKRMIKNRESAARSRARKQAYTQELENKISRLEEENERLRRQKEIEKVLPCAPPPEPKRQLRRTSSSPL